MSFSATHNCKVLRDRHALRWEPLKLLHVPAVARLAAIKVDNLLMKALQSRPVRNRQQSDALLHTSLHQLDLAIDADLYLCRC